MGKVYVEDSGTLLSLDTNIDLADTTTHEIWIKKPDGTILKKSATVNETNLEYELEPDDIDAAGVYKAMAYIESPSFPTGKSGEVFSFTIYNQFM